MYNWLIIDYYEIDYEIFQNLLYLDSPILGQIC